MNQLSLNFNVEPGFSYTITESENSFKLNSIRIGVELSLEKKKVGEIYISWQQLLDSQTTYSAKQKDGGKAYIITLYEQMIVDLQENLSKLKNK